jgi:ADP-heptose:LPS heptosyltransferase
MSGASAFLGNDSGLGHIAAAMGVPTVTVFGPGRPARYRPWGPRSEIVLAPNEDLSELQPALVAEVMTSHLAKPSRGV